MQDEAFQRWCGEFSDVQIASLGNLRSLILENTQELDETINEGKWLNNCVFYSYKSKMVYGIGPKGKTKVTFHMLPYYMSSQLQEKHGPTLAPFLTGKSCIAFEDFTKLPITNLVDILKTGIPDFLK